MEFYYVAFLRRILSYLCTWDFRGFYWLSESIPLFFNLIFYFISKLNHLLPNDIQAMIILFVYFKFYLFPLIRQMMNQSFLHFFRKWTNLINLNQCLFFNRLHLFRFYFTLLNFKCVFTSNNYLSVIFEATLQKWYF